jgi:hypothetical protein
MNEDTSGEEYIQKKFQISIGDEIAWVEVISAINHIYAVQFRGREPLFISLITDKDNNPKWISIPQGNDEMAAAIGKYIEGFGPVKQP